MVDRAIRRVGSLRQERRPVPRKRRYPNLATLGPPANTRWDAMVKAYESIGFRLCYGPALEAELKSWRSSGRRISMAEFARHMPRCSCPVETGQANSGILRMSFTERQRM